MVPDVQQLYYDVGMGGGLCICNSGQWNRYRDENKFTIAWHGGPIETIPGQ